jgi:hypothetical protein
MWKGERKPGDVKAFNGWSSFVIKPWKIVTVKLKEITTDFFLSSSRLYEKKNKKIKVSGRIGDGVGPNSAGDSFYEYQGGYGPGVQWDRPMK